MVFRQTKSGIAICPFFTWTSENIEGEGHSENDVNLVYCVHPANKDNYEGNCREDTCPIIISEYKRNMNGVCPNCGLRWRWSKQALKGETDGNSRT